MAPTVPSVTDLYNAFVDDYVSRTGAKTPLLRRAVVRMLAWPFAGLTVLAYRYGQFVYFEMFLETCSFDALKKYGYRVGVDWQDGTQSVALVTLTGVSALSIPAGTTFVAPNGTVFRTESSTPVSGGVAICAVVSTSTGAFTNVNVGDEMTCAITLAGIPTFGIVSAVSEEGEDPESVEDYRVRVRSRYRLQPQGGAFADYWIWTTGVDGIVDALIYIIQPGIVNVYPIANGSGSERLPSSTKIAEVESEIRSSPGSTLRDRHPVQSQLNVAAPTEAAFTVRVSGLVASANNAENRATMRAAIIEYMDSRRPQIPAIGYTAAGGTVTTAEVTSAVIDTLVNATNSGTFASVVVEYGGSSIGDRKVLGVGQLAKLSALYVNGSLVL